MYCKVLLFISSKSGSFVEISNSHSSNKLNSSDPSMEPSLLVLVLVLVVVVVVVLVLVVVVVVVVIVFLPVRIE